MPTDGQGLMRSLCETADVIILLLDIEGRILRFNAYMEQISGYRLSEVAGKDWFTGFLPERDRERMRNYFSTVLERDETRGMVNPILTRDGRERLIEWHNKTQHDSSGKTLGVLCIGLDVTERWQAETWANTLIETSQDAVVAIDRDGHIVLFNSAAERIFGYEKKEVFGQRVSVLMPEPYASEHNGYVRRYEETGEARAIGRIRTVKAKRKNGEVFPVELSVTAVPASETVTYAAFIRDISQKEKLQAQLVEQERMAVIGATAASFVHEIGNPLNGMSMTAQLLERRLEDYRDILEASVYGQLQNLQMELRRLTELLSDFRSVARKDRYQFQPTSIPSLCAEVLSLEQQTFASLGITLESHFQKDLPDVKADRDRLKQALLNLCKNGVEAMPGGGKITVRARRAGPDVVLEVADTGVGIESSTDIFEPFATTKPKGTGLGLMITRKIVAAHGGTISYLSERGNGTVFRLTLPVSET